jgi:predicted ribosome quality control (RQC) complex YloA/Tae2 family protein
VVDELSAPGGLGGKGDEPFSAADLEAVVAELEPAVAGSRLRDVHDAGETSLVLALRAPRETHHLFLSVRPGAARLHRVERRPQAPVSPSSFCRLLRSRLRGARLEALRRLPSEPGVELLFRSRRREAEAGEGEMLQLVQRLSRRPHIRLESAGERLGVLEPAPGGGMRLPILSPAPALAKEPSGPEGAVSRFPASEGLARRFSGFDEQADLEARRRELVTALGRERRRRRVILGKIASDLERLEGAADDLRRGELLKASFAELQRGLASIEVVDYYSPGLERVSIPLDPRLAPQENIERYFRRHQKRQRALPILKARREKIEGEERRLESLETRAKEAADAAALGALAAEAAGLLRRPSAGERAARRRRAERPGGPRRFVSLDGYEILAGRSARENDELTRRLARGNDLFLHVSGRPGAHVIIRTQPGKSVPPDTLLDAAQLALYYSLPERSGGVFHAPVSADIDYAPVKHVHKPRGARPGAVLLSQRKTLRVQLEQARIERLRAGSGEAGGSSPAPPEPEVQPPNR